MRLKEFQVKQLCQSILSTLRAKNLLEPLKSDSEILNRMEAIFQGDLKVEDEINKEANALLDQYAAQMGDNVDKQQLFQMIKKQLIKDKKVVI